MRTPAIDVYIVRPSTVERVLAVVGRARPIALVDVRSPNPGKVIALLHDDGDRVAPGEPLAIIEATVEQAQTQVGMAQARVARAERDRARLAFERTRILADKGIMARVALDEARAALQAAQAGLDAATATTAAASERVRQFTVRAPMAGLVLYRPIDSGQVVSSTTSLFQLGSLQGAEIQVQVDEAYADSLRPGLDARAVLTGSDQTFRARIAEISPQVDSATGGRLIKLVPIDGPDLAPGRSIDISIVVDRRTDRIVIPRGAVIDPSTTPGVYVVDSGGMVRLRRVSIMRWPSPNAIIETGLVPGDMVVLDPAETRPNAHVRPVTPAARRDR
jgi:RND family efflux transporter MFP subunit